MIKYVKDFSFPPSAGFSGSAGKQMVKGYARGGQPKAQAKVGKVMGEYGKGELHSGSKSGPLVKNPKQAIAIALSEARKAGAKMPVKKAEGGTVKEPKSAYPKIETPTQKKAREQQAQDVMERASKHADELAKGPGYEGGGRVKPAVMPGKSGTAGRPESTGLDRAAEMSGRAMPTIGRPAMKKGGKVKNYADGGYVNEEPGYEQGYAGTAVMPGRSGVTGRPNLTGLGRAAQMSGRTMPTTGRPAMKNGGKVVEKGSGEAYASKAAMKRHEAKESAAKERAEHGKAKGGKMADGGVVVPLRKTSIGPASLPAQAADRAREAIAAAQDRAAARQASFGVRGRSEEGGRGKVEQKDIVSRETKASPRSMMDRRQTERMRRYEGQRPNLTPMVMKKGGYAEGGKMADLKQDKQMVKAAVHKHEKAMHPGKPMTKLRKGGMAC